MLFSGNLGAEVTSPHYVDMLNVGAMEDLASFYIRLQKRKCNIK